MSDKKFATLFTMKGSDDDNSDDESKERGQAFYAGGSEHSGQQILGPDRPKPDDVIKKVFSAAREHGAEEVGPPSTGSRNRPGPSTFLGAGHRLGSGEDGGELGDAERANTVQERPYEIPEPVEMTLRMWRNGFSVDGGPLRGYDEEENREFLSTIQRGEIPQELITEARGGEVGLNMEDCRSRDYEAPKRAAKPFQGEGHMLGSPVPLVSSVDDGASNEKVDDVQVDLRDDEPTTQLQIRLADGDRLIQRFNQSHTISDVRNFIVASRPGYATQCFVLMTTFPNKQITDESETLANAKLLNAVIVQRLTPQ